MSDKTSEIKCIKCECWKGLNVLNECQKLALPEDIEEDERGDLIKDHYLI